MNTLKKLREKTGFSQYKIASWLGISRSYINMAERGLRELPKEASEKLMAALVHIEENVAQGKNISAPRVYDQKSLQRVEALAEEHKRKMEEHLYKMRGLQRRLDKIIKKHKGVDARFVFLDTLNGEEFTKTKRDEDWIGFMSFFTKEEPSKSFSEQEILQDKIDLHLAYAEIHKKHLQKFSKI